MYNNGMNNNQNFNNSQRPLFENEFINSMSNVNSQDTFNPNYENIQTQFSPSNQTLPNFQNQQVSQSNVFENNFNQMNEQMNPNFQGMTNYDFNQPTGDIPPELGEIKNLSDATIVSAPTMDVLDPMNVMPENINNNDPLENYENGSLNNFSSGVGDNTNFNNNNNQSINSNFSTPFITSNFSNNEYNFNNNLNVPSYQNPIPSLNQFGTNINNLGQNMLYNTNNSLNETPMIQTQSNNMLYDENITKTTNVSYNNSITNPSFEEPTSIKNNITSELYGTTENKINNNEQQSYSPVSNEENESNYYENAQIDNLNKEESSYNIVESKISDSVESNDIAVTNQIDNNEEQYDSVVENDTEKSDYYTIVQNDELNQDEKENMSLSDLGIEESYNEPDTLDILDVDEDETSKTQESSEIMVSISENIEKIKNLIEEIKSNGVNIDLEEFDFEQMYQLIIKINK